MEEKTKGQEKRLSYNELKANFDELLNQYNKLMDAFRNAQKALQSNNFDVTSFFISMLFKVMEHPDQYKKEFVDWCRDNIQSALVGYAETFAPEEEKKDEAK